MVNIVFTDPPPTARRGRSPHPWHEIAAALRDRPGEWALCIRGVHDSTASSIRLGKLQAFAPAGTFDARTVRPADNPTADRKQPVFDLYIRYLGEDATSS